MGRGRSKAGRNPKGSITLPGTGVVEFDGTLNYGKKDPNIPDNIRDTIETWEKKRLKAKSEYAFSVDADGNVIGEKRGGKTSVRTPRVYVSTPDATFTHIHPRQDESGVLGGTFSEADLFNFATYNARTYRAAAKEGTYTISKKANFDQDGFYLFTDKANYNFNKYVKEANESLLSKVREGSLSYKEYTKRADKVFNTGLVKYHNELLSGQKKYGYYYALERP